MSSNSNTIDIDNSDYTLTNKQLYVSGVGESRNQQQARNKSRAAALDSAVAILRESISAIAEERGFKSDTIETFQFSNTRVTAERTTAFTNNNGVRIYRHTQTLCIELEPLLKNLYDKLGTSVDYGWDMFLRDMDHQLDLKNNKQ